MIPGSGAVSTTLLCELFSHNFLLLLSSNIFFDKTLFIAPIGIFTIHGKQIKSNLAFHELLVTKIVVK